MAETPTPTETPTPAPAPTPTPTPKPTAAQLAAAEAEASTIKDAVAPYAPFDRQEEGVDIMIARDGSGTHQLEPYTDEFPADAKVEPGLSQINTRNQLSVGAPINVDASPEPGTPADGARITDEARAKVIEETLEAFADHSPREERLGKDVEKPEMNKRAS